MEYQTQDWANLPSLVPAGTTYGMSKSADPSGGIGLGSFGDSTGLLGLGQLGLGVFSAYDQYKTNKLAREGAKLSIAKDRQLLDTYNENLAAERATQQEMAAKKATPTVL